MRYKISQYMLVVTLLGIILLLNILSVRHKTLTYDESDHYSYGIRILQLNSDRVHEHDNSKMPFSCLNVIPRGVGKLLKLISIHGKFINFLYDVKTGRYITVLFSLLLAFYIFKWAKELYGFIPGIFSLVIYTFSPNIIAHSRLVTTDLYAACMVTVSTYYFWRFIKFGGWKRAALSAFTLSLAQLAKYTCIYLYPIFAMILFMKYSGHLLKLIRTGGFKDLLIRLKVFSRFLLFFVVIGIAIINIGFHFNKTFIPLEKYEFKSDLLKTAQSKFVTLRHFPIPFPYPYIQGLDLVKFHEKTGAEFGNIYLLGKLQESGKNFKGFKGYYFYTFLFKVPVTIQLFIVFSIIAYVINRKKYNFLENEMFLLCPVLFFTIYFNFLFKAQIGIRFLLVAFPFLYIFCGSFLKNWKAFKLKQKSTIIFLISYLIISVLSYFPHYLSYFNELVWDRKQAYKILADSNIDWGQNEWYISKYLEKNPNIYVNPEFPVAGRVVVSVNELVGVFGAKKYRWLRDNFKPADHIAYSYLVYDILPEALKKVR